VKRVNPAWSRRRSDCRQHVQARGQPPPPRKASDIPAEEITDWFERNVPNSPFYQDGNRIRTVTWFKSDAVDAIGKARVIADIVGKHGIKIKKVVHVCPGKVIYEDEYQIGIIDE
jgi:hypothetical protein